MKHERQKEQLIEDTIKNTNPLDRASIITNKMIEVLSLSEVQKNQVDIINKDYSMRYNFLVESTNPKLQKRKEFLKLMQEKDTALKNVLNNTQMTKWHAVRDEFWEEYRIL